VQLPKRAGESIIQKQMTYRPSKATTLLNFGIATRFGRYRPSSGCQHNISHYG